MKHVRGIPKTLLAEGMMVIFFGIMFCYAKYNVQYVLNDRDINELGEVNYGPKSPCARGMFAYIEQHTARSDLVTFFNPRWVYRLSTRLAFQSDKVGDALRSDFICLDKMDRWRMQMPVSDVRRLIEEGAVIRVYSNDEFDVLHVVRRN